MRPALLQKLADHIAGCFDRAATFEHRAAQTTDPAIRRHYEEIAEAWRHLAASYQFSEALERFILDAEQARNAPPTPPTAPE
jgi:hypothetical protein